MELLVIPLVVGVFAFVHRVILFIGTLRTLLPSSFVTYLKMTIKAKQDAIAERIRATVFYWLSMMWLPTSTLAFGTVAPNKPFAASTTRPALPVPSFLYSVGRKSHRSTSHRVTNGWVDKGKNVYVLFQNGKSTGMTIVGLPFMYHGKSKRPVYDIRYGSKYLGYAWSLIKAKSRAEAYLKKMRRT